MKDRNSSYPVKIGNTTFIVCVKQSESAKKDLDTVFQDICKHEALGDFFTGKSFNLENSQNLHKKTLAFLSLWCYITYRTKEMTRQVSFLTKPLVEGC